MRKWMLVAGAALLGWLGGEMMVGDPALRVSSSSSFERLSLDDVAQYRAQFVRPDLTTLVVVGDVDPAAVRANVERAFGDWSASGPKPEATASPAV